jgi:chemotaxis response regulator CheB
MRRVLLVFSSRLFGLGVENLLRQEPGLAVWSCEPDVNKAVERIHALQPDVVIVEHRELAVDLKDAVRQMLRACEHLTVIELDLEDDTACIYSGQQQAIKHVQDLVEVIEQAAAR